MADTATPTTHGNFNANLRLVIIIAVAIVVGLTAFFVGKSVVDSIREGQREAEAARIAAEERVVYLSKNPGELQTWAEMEWLQGELGLDTNDQVWQDITAQWLNRKLDEAASLSVKVDKDLEYLFDFPQQSTNNPWTKRLGENRGKLKALIDEYAKGYAILTDFTKSKNRYLPELTYQNIH